MLSSCNRAGNRVWGGVSCVCTASLRSFSGIAAKMLNLTSFMSFGVCMVIAACSGVVGSTGGVTLLRNNDLSHLMLRSS